MYLSLDGRLFCLKNAPISLVRSFCAIRNDTILMEERKAVQQARPLAAICNFSLPESYMGKT